jgi:hypothetical protein
MRLTRKWSVGAAGKMLLGVALTSLNLFLVRSANAAGVTVITHGYAGDVTGWITAMADAIPGYFHSRYPEFGTNLTIYTLILTTDGSNYYYQWERDSGGSPINTDTGEIIVKLDWSQMAGGLTAPYDISTSNVAWVASYVLSQTNTIADLNGHALVEFPIHLIGHSRGGSLVSEISRILGTNGIWVDHLTTLDPHPLNNDGNDDSPLTTVDAPVHTYVNVLYHDNYWQDLGDGTFVPDGEAVAGAYVRQLTDLAGGYPSAWYDFLNSYEYHSNVHLWYYGSIDLNVPTTYDDDGETITLTAAMRTSWWVNYEQAGTNAGFEYSLIGGGNRFSEDHPLGLPSDPAIIDGYNQWWDLGAGSSTNRTALTSNNGTWPNLIKFNVTGTNIVSVGQTIAIRFYYQYGGTASNVTAQFYFDQDLNPYNSNSTFTAQSWLPNTGVNFVYADTADLATSNMPPGIYAICGKISDGAHTRYLYAPELVQIVPSQEPPVLSILKLADTQFVVGIDGVAGQTVILQTSADLQNWLPLATNTMTTGSWIYTNDVPPVFSQQFYRAVLGR